MTTKTGQRGLFYTRDSGGKHETTPAQYVEWARRRAEELGATLVGTGNDITTMIDARESCRGDLYLDYGVSGNVLARPGLDALRARVRSDKTISHVFIPRRDRLARPDDAMEAIQIEDELRKCGAVLVYMDRVLVPVARGQRSDVAEKITQMIDFDQAGRFRLDLAQKMVLAQLTLARAGYSTGGRAPFGFDRWLVRVDGERVRQLEDGERVRMAGHHVVWIPASDDRLELALRIRSMLTSMPATQVARQLNRERIPSPDAGRTRTDQGVMHTVSGHWHTTTINNIGRNPLWTAIVRHGLRSMGDQTRFTPEGPRALHDGDFRSDGKPKVVRNPPEQHIISQAHFAPVVNPGDHDRLQKILDDRAGTQKGKPRSRDPQRNPLGCRVFDMACGWPMYRVAYQGSFKYRCGQYQQSHGQSCHHNQVDGVLATRFAMSCVTQQLLAPKRVERLKQMLQKLAAHKPSGGSATSTELKHARGELSEKNRQLETVCRNMALAATEEQFRSISEVFDQLTADVQRLQAHIEVMEAKNRPHQIPQEEVQQVLNLVDRLAELAQQTEGLAAARKLMDLANLRMFLAFVPVRNGKRILNKLQHGIVTIGNAPAPVRIYAGPTARNHLCSAASEAAAAGDACSPAELSPCGGEEQSLRNANRDDRS